jgi:hypothetical protein
MTNHIYSDESVVMTHLTPSMHIKHSIVPRTNRIGCHCFQILDTPPHTRQRASTDFCFKIDRAKKWLACLMEMCSAVGYSSELPGTKSSYVNAPFNATNIYPWMSQRSGLVRNWSPRFFIVSEEQLDAQIKYYTNSDREELKGTINVQEITEIRDVSESPSPCPLLLLFQ